MARVLRELGEIIRRLFFKNWRTLRKLEVLCGLFLWRAIGPKGGDAVNGLIHEIRMGHLPQVHFRLLLRARSSVFAFYHTKRIGLSQVQINISRGDARHARVR